MGSATTKSVVNTGILVLAAGKSSRLGRPKQLLVYDDRTLLKHTLQEAESSDATSIVVVLGAYAAAIAGETIGERTRVVLNPHWEDGIGSSVRCGIGALIERDSSVEGCVIMVCDQPYVTATLVNSLIAKHVETGKKIVASAYGGSYGPPCFFHRSFFPELLELSGDTGGKGLIFSHLSEMVPVDFPEGVIDIDTEADYHRILNQK